MKKPTIDFGTFKEKIGEEKEKDKYRFNHPQYQMKGSTGYERFQFLNFQRIYKQKGAFPYPREED